jgi:putative selenium metabolism hydrolase
MSGHETLRLEALKRRIVELGAVSSSEDVFLDEFGSLVWQVEDKSDRASDKTVVWFDGHSDTVDPLPDKWHEGCGVDPFEGLSKATEVNEEFLLKELEYIPPQSEWEHLVFGRGTADQLAGVVTQVFATKILLELHASTGCLKGLKIRSVATISEEDNDGGSPLFFMRTEFPQKKEWIPDVVCITEATGDTKKGRLGLYRGQRGRATIQLRLVGKSCHGSMPHLGLNPLEYGAHIIVEAEQQVDSFKTHPFLGKGTRTASWSQVITPSDCAVPQEFIVKFDRRLTIGETAEGAVQELESLAAVQRARDAGLTVEVTIPTYTGESWRGVALNNQQAYLGWVTPEDHPVVTTGVRAFQETVGGNCRVDSWVFSTDGVGYVTPHAFWMPSSWIKSGEGYHPPMVGIGPGREQHAHRIGEYMDMREVVDSTAMLAAFSALYRK